MKKSLILLTFVFLTSVAFAQKGVSGALSAKEQGKLDKALEAIEAVINSTNPKDAKTINNPRTWEVRGEILQAIAQSKDANVKKLAADPLAEALKSYKKALELDTKGRNANSVKIKLTLMENDFMNQAVEAFNNEDYNKAMLSFEQMLDMKQLPVIRKDNPNAIDTVIIFNAGLAAFNAKNYEKAIQYYKEAAKYGYNGGRTYSLLSKAHLENKDTLTAITALNEAFEKYPTDNSVLVEMINVYISTKKTDEAMKYLSLAIEQDPTNPSYYFAQGSLLDGMGQQDDAVKSYEKAIELNKEFYDAYYNLGALYYNNGVKQIEVANKVPANDNKKYEEELAKSDIWFAKALPFMEKCQELKPGDPYSLESLKNLYYRLKQLDKYEEVLKKLGQ
ncbi:MAG: tetratricopeptide repeat protein [Prolixibacteraceae bacterium]|jgi:tetratricopeptide (TPR) repeat protein|nr:tetratricopeptide repeat protein [Prolixibacteraceae bacterium]NLX29899.1 tetratricopeptide repeat protein [Bacteroidales bacterium]HPJ77608.1 tetratricopeptide repeat protein [Prolixibacteraceae bacterium]HRV88497.1 tetratricopeptide repeat protein [Prolixibacteraceae bacterium]